ncbi:MAG: GTPase Era, partial [Clostridia bacterium]|nr:GTPase Era [Clostridia bacterium]
ILTEGENQFVFLDTPGIHKAKTKLGNYMMKSVRSSLGTADAVILIADAGKAPGEIERNICEKVKADKTPAMLVLNKIDLVDRAQVAETIAQYASLYDFDAFVPVSALKGRNLKDVMDEAEKFLYEGEWFFEEDMITDQPEKQIAAEIIREKMLRTLSKEIPHGSAVVIEEFKEDEDLLSIRAEIYCEKESHKGIIVGKGGEMLKRIGSYAREDLEDFFGMKVYLNLWVKVKENWRDNEYNLNNFGFNPKELD